MKPLKKNPKKPYLHDHVTHLPNVLVIVILYNNGSRFDNTTVSSFEYRSLTLRMCCLTKSKK